MTKGSPHSSLLHKSTKALSFDALTSSLTPLRFLLQHKYNEDELIQAMKGVHIIGVRSKTKLTARVLEAADKLVAVGCFCIGTDQVSPPPAFPHQVAHTHTHTRAIKA